MYLHKMELGILILHFYMDSNSAALRHVVHMMNTYKKRYKSISLPK